MKNDPIHIYSEIGTLKKVMLHRPGRELENLTPEYLEQLLFDDIPYLELAQQEHDTFANILRQQGIEVVYLEDLTAEAILDEEIRRKFILDFLWEAGIDSDARVVWLTKYLQSLTPKEMVLKMMSGVRKEELNCQSSRSLREYLDQEYPFLFDPMPNLYFTRDPFAAVENGICIHRMFTSVRNRESLFAKYIFRYHPVYGGTKLWYDRYEQFSLEGGDILVLNQEVLAIGISQRTHPGAIEKLADRLLGETTGRKKILAIDIPKHRSFMHLDTIFTMVDRDKFTIHPNIAQELMVYVLEKDEDGQIRTTPQQGTLEDILKEHLRLEHVTLIQCGGGCGIDAAREQWSDASNTLCIAPGKVVVYSRNHVTNRLLEENGIQVHEIPSAELSRGRGGPRCMSMPLFREDLETHQ